MKASSTKTPSPRRSLSRRCKEARGHVVSTMSKSPRNFHWRQNVQNQAATDKAIGIVAKRGSTRRPSTSGGRIQPCSKGHSSRSTDRLFDPVSYPPDAIARRVAMCSQSDSKYGTCAKPSGLSPAEYRFIGKALSRNSQNEVSWIDSETVSFSFSFTLFGVYKSLCTRERRSWNMV